MKETPKPILFTEDELVYIRESVYLRSDKKNAARKSILLKIPATLTSK